MEGVTHDLPEVLGTGVAGDLRASLVLTPAL